ncbi:MAG: hypothetical protein ACRCZ9_12415 [Fusobacteriaceae bacterium]
MKKTTIDLKEVLPHGLFNAMVTEKVERFITVDSDEELEILQNILYFLAEAFRQVGNDTIDDTDIQSFANTLSTMSKETVEKILNVSKKTTKDQTYVSNKKFLFLGMVNYMIHDTLNKKG